MEVKIKKGEEKVIPFVWINGESEEILADVLLNGDGANVHIVGIFLGTGHHTATFNTHVIHKGLKTFSRTTIRAVFLDNATFNNDGLIRIDKGAKGADGYFASKILLFNDAKGRSVPSLEIDENDLKAGHASTVGRPDQEQLFYMQSRGLSVEEAEKLIITGFFDPALSFLPKKQQIETKQNILKTLDNEKL